MPSGYYNHNHNHNHNYRNHNDYDGNKKSSASFKQMSNFEVLPSTPTSSSSTTPGPPPFNIIDTPLFDSEACDYSIHPDTLRHMNRNANSFDTDYSYEGQQEGYDQEFNTFIQKKDKNYTYSHKTIVTQLSQSIIQTSTIKTPTQIHAPYINKPSTIHKPSPSLLDTNYSTDKGNHNNNKRKNEPNLKTGSASPPYHVQMPHSKTLHTQPMPQITFQPTLSDDNYLDSTWSSLNRMGFNTVSVIIILLGIVVLYQYQLYNNLHGKAEIPVYINPNSTEHNEPYNMTDIIEKLMQKVEKNTIDIGEVKQDTIPELEKKTQDIEDIVDTMKHNEDSLETEKRDWFAAYNTVNYISGISAKPDIIPFTVIDDDNSNNQVSNNKVSNNNDNDKGIFETVGIGLGRLKKQITQKPKKNNIDWNELDDRRHRYLGNNNIISPDTSSTLNPHDCLQFAAEDNWIEFHLSHRIKPTNFKYIHIDKNKIDKSDWNKSPKKFTLKGKLKTNDEWKLIKIDQKHTEKEEMKEKDSSIELQLIPDKEIEFVRVEYETNPDAKTTRLYRFRIGIGSDSEKIAENDERNDSDNDNKI